ncbi:MULTISPECIES: amidohydrolase [unclassified Pseudoxanthomonas]|uniref:amidohydrolase n=1 Tax=unclassified Pseudoxanthomonas TaxID=2645906 RepID=UPI0002F5C6D7|nr:MULTISPECIES: amidohydrolase [unclassified Pseudoxanthomonas]
MHRRVTRALPLLLAAFASAMALASPQSPAPQPAPPSYAGTTAEAVLTARRIHTLDAAHPQATAIAWDKDGRILATGEAAELRHRYPQARHIDAGDATVIPGLIDAHAHLMELGYALLRADLSGARSVGEVVQRLQAHAATAPEDAWIVGWGWDQNLWPGARFPTAADLDAAFPDRPVWLSRIDGHAAWANTAAMRAAEALEGARRFDGDWQPEGGRIERGHGRATGVFVDGAMRLVERAMPPPDEAWRARALEQALALAVANGLTGVHDMGVSRADLALMRRFADEGRLPLRISAYADGDREALADLCEHGAYQHPGGRLQMKGVKLFVDGALGSRGAALLQDYSDAPGNRGLLVTDPAAYGAAVIRARDCGLQVATHAIGDRGNRIVLDTYQQALAGLGARADHRWRVEHAQVVAPEDFPRFAALRLVASMQPTHATSDMGWAGARLGEKRLAGAYAWRRFLDLGVPLALGSDFPVEQVDPRLGLLAAVTRQDRDGQPPGGWLPGQRLGALEALRGFTVDAARAGHDESRVGRLAPGLRADFVVLDRDPLAIPGAELDALQVRATWVDGQPVFTAE